MSVNDNKPRSVSFNDDNVSQEGEARRANDVGTYSVRVSSPSKIRPSYESSDLSTQYVLDKANQALRKSFLVTQSSPSKSHYVSSSPIRSSYIPSSTTVTSGTAGVAKTYEILAKANDALRKSNVATSSSVSRGYSPSRRDYSSVATDILVSEALRKSAIARSRSPSPSKYRAAPVSSVSSYIRDLENARLHNALRKSQEIVHEIKRSQEVVNALKRSQDLTNALRKSQEIQRVNEIVRRNEEINRLNNALRKSQEIRAAETLRKSQELRADLRTAEILRKSQEIRAADALRKSQELRRALSPVYYDPLPSTVISDYLKTSYQSDRFYNALKKSQEIVNAKIVSDLRKSQEIRKALNESAGSFGSPRRARDASLNDAYNDALRRSTSLLAKEADKSLERSFVIDRVSSSPGKERALSASVRSTATDGLRYVDERYSDGSSYRGDKLNLLKHGKGEFVYADGRRYQGEWAFDRRHGYGVLRENNGLIIYDGEWKDGVYHGNGTLYNNNSRFETEFTYLDFNTLGLAWVKYDGEFYEGQWHGLGTLTILNNQKYSGKFRFDRVNGTGTFYKSNGLAVSGEWLENKFIRAY